MRFASRPLLFLFAHVRLLVPLSPSSLWRPTRKFNLHGMSKVPFEFSLSLSHSFLLRSLPPRRGAEMRTLIAASISEISRSKLTNRFTQEMVNLPLTRHSSCRTKYLSPIIIAYIMRNVQLTCFSHLIACNSILLHEIKDRLLIILNG